MINYNILDTIDLVSLDDAQIIQTTIYRHLQRINKENITRYDKINILLGDHDYYVEDNLVGLKLEITQTAINDMGFKNDQIQILTTNPDIDQEIDQLSQRAYDLHSKFSATQMQGDYRKISNGVLLNNYQYSSKIPSKVKLDELTDRELHLLTESKTFCMYPWIHMNASPNGEAMPCCLWDYNVKMGSTKEHTIRELWNNDNWKDLRKNMLSEVKSEGCKKCYEEEDNGFFSNRQSANKHHGHHIKRINDTTNSGHLDQFEMTYWDIRFSNLCNLSCRSCGHIFSSSWYQDQAKLSGSEWAKKNKALFWAGRHETDMIEQLIEHIDYVEQIYFAGGEPLSMDEHYAILEELDRRQKFNVRLVYNTNFTKTKLKDRYVFDYWRKFDSVSVGASLDAMGPRAEYIRKGTNWTTVEENRKMMMEVCPNVDFYISPTLSILNAWHLPDFHRDWVDRGLLKPQDLNINLLTDPSYLRVDIATDEYKNKLIEKYEEHLKWLKPLDKFNRATQGFESAINFMKSQENSYLLEKFWYKTNQLDIIRKENILEAIPELNELTK